MGVQNSQRIQDLEQTFQVFNQVSERLETSYHQLEDQVTRLHVELEDSARQALNQHANQAAPRVADIGESASGDSRLRTILSVLPAGVVVLDGLGRIQECNPAAIELLGEPLLGEVWNQIIGRAFAPRSDDGHEISLKDGRRVSISTCPLGNEPGQVLLLTDVTETRELQNTFSQHQRLAAMGEMAAGLAHQIRTPLSSGLLFASQLKNQNLEVDKRRSITDKVMSQLRQLESLIDDMLMFSRGGYGGKEKINVDSMVNNLADAISDSCEKRNITLSVNSDLSGLHIVGNQKILHSAFLNLASNAVQAIGHSGNLNISVKKGVCDTVEICVSDDGPGVPAEIRDKLFKPFFTTRSNGTGLGLAVVQAVVRAHSGNVRLESIEKSGSKFIVQLPILLVEDSLVEVSESKN